MPTQGVAHRIADGERPIAVWRVEACISVRKLSRMTKIDFNRLMQFELGQAEPHDDELEAIGTALRVVPSLLKASGGG